MAFDPLSWAIDYTLEKGFDKFLDDDKLLKDIEKHTHAWAKKLPQNAFLQPEALFPDISSDCDLSSRPALYVVRQKLSNDNVPTKSEWLNAFLEQWHVVESTVEAPQSFFLLSESDAKCHLDELANIVTKRCKQCDRLFKASIFDRLEEIRKVLGGNKSHREQPLGPVHNLPYTSIGSLLKGRDEAMKILHERFSSTDQNVAITQPNAIHGLGGVGKTQLAVEYALHALKNKSFNAVFFVIADSPASINTNLAALAASSLLNLAEANQPDQSVIVDAVIRSLASRDNWLLIFDNVDTPEARKYLNQILPHLSLGRIIITSRSSNWPAGIEDLSIDKLSTSDAVAYLCQTTQAKRTASNDDKQFAAKLAEELDGLPIALEQFAAYINQRRISFKTCLSDLEQSAKEVLSFHKKELVNYPLPVLAVWHSTDKQLSHPARAILRLVSLLSPEPIPAALFESSPDKISEAASLLCRAGFTPPKSKSDVRGLLSELSDWSMIKLTDDFFAIHRLTQDSIRLSIPEKDLKNFTRIILNIVNAFAPTDSDDVRTWPILDVLRPHAELIAEIADKENITDPTSRLISVLGTYLHYKGLYSEAEKWKRRALEIDEKSFGKDHPNVAIRLNNLAQLYKATNRYQDAEPMMKRALAIDEKSFGKDHPKVAIDLNNLAQLYKATNRYQDAEPMMKRVVEILEKSLGKDHPNVATALNNLAQLYKATNRYQDAEPMMKRALAIDEKSFGKDHPKVAIRLNNLAQLYQATNRYQEAEPMMKRALKIFEESLGTDHPHTQTVRQNLEILLLRKN